MPWCRTALVKTKALLFLALAAVLSGCASVFNDTSPPVRITSEPADADVTVDGHYIGKTPITAELSTKTSHQVRIEKEGYQGRTKFIQSNTGALWVVLDILFGLIPIVIDAVTGDWAELETENVNVVLEKSRDQ